MISTTNLRNPKRKRPEAKTKLTTQQQHKEGGREEEEEMGKPETAERLLKRIKFTSVKPAVPVAHFLNKKFNLSWKERTVQEVYVRAAKDGRLDLITWINQQAYHWDDSTELHDKMAHCAAKRGRLKVLKWLVQQKKRPLCMGIGEAAARGGQLHVLKWFHKKGGILTEYACSCAAGFNHLRVLKWIHKHLKSDVVRTTYVFASAATAEPDGVSMMKWLLKKKYPFDEEACAFAACANNLKNLKWMRKHDFPWNKRTYIFAQKYGDEVFRKWICEQGCPVE